MYATQVLCKEKAELKGKAANLTVSLHFHPSPMVRSCGLRPKNEMVKASGGNEFPVKGGRA